MASAIEYKLGINEQEHALLLMKNLQETRMNSEDCDFIIKVEGEEIQVHRAVMSAMSDFFKVMLSHDTAENRSGVVEMKQVGYKFVKKGVDYIYGKNIAICEDDCEELLIVATMMQLPRLCTKVEEFLLPRLNSRMFFGFRSMADKFNCSLLREACYVYASENLGAISKEHEFENLDAEYMTTLMARKSSYSEDVKVAVILSWIKYDADKRKSYLCKILEVINLDEISPQYSRYLIEREALCFESAECLRMLFMAATREVTAMTAPPDVSFNGSNNALIIFDLNYKALIAYHPAKNSWTKKHVLHPDLVESLGFTAVMRGSVLYVAVATKKFLQLNVLEIGSEWEELPSMNSEHGVKLRAAVLDKFIYVVGGGSMERFDVCNKVWERVDSDTATNMDECSIVGYDGHIWILGGINQGSLSNAVHAFSSEASTWNRVVSLPNYMSNVASVCWQDKIYVTGGSNWYIYDSKTRYWSSFSYMRRSHNNHSLCIVEKQLFAVGGNSPQTMEKYDFSSNQWTEYQLPKDMKIMSSATVALWLP